MRRWPSCGQLSKLGRSLKVVMTTTVDDGVRVEEAGAAERVDGTFVDERDAAELREIAELQKEIAEQEALLDEHQSKLVSEQ